MEVATYSLTDLAELTGIEPRTIRSYIERGLLPGADARGRGATYSAEHLSRLQVIQAFRRARPNIALSEVRILLQQLTPDQIYSFASGDITAATRVLDESTRPDDDDSVETAADDDEFPRPIDWDQSATKLTGLDRLVCLLRQVSGFTSAVPASKMVAWQRIAVTPDVELSVRAEFDKGQLALFRDLADLLRHLIQHTDALTRKGGE